MNVACFWTERGHWIIQEVQFCAITPLSPQSSLSGSLLSFYLISLWQIVLRIQFDTIIYSWRMDCKLTGIVAAGVCEQHFLSVESGRCAFSRDTVWVDNLQSWGRGSGFPFCRAVCSRFQGNGDGGGDRFYPRSWFHSGSGYAISLQWYGHYCESKLHVFFFFFFFLPVNVLSRCVYFSCFYTLHTTFLCRVANAKLFSISL